jgi:hypothetical protein
MRNPPQSTSRREPRRTAAPPLLQLPPLVIRSAVRGGYSFRGEALCPLLGSYTRSRKRVARGAWWRGLAGVSGVCLVVA